MQTDLDILALKLQRQGDKQYHSQLSSKGHDGTTRTDGEILHGLTTAVGKLHEMYLRGGFTQEDLKSDFEVFEPKPGGCDKCKDGYKGRVGIYEVVKITPELSRIIMEDGNSIELSEQARKHGYNDLRRDGLVKVKEGLTSLAEANRVTTGH